MPQSLACAPRSGCPSAIRRRNVLLPARRVTNFTIGAATQSRSADSALAPLPGRTHARSSPRHRRPTKLVDQTHYLVVKERDSKQPCKATVSFGASHTSNKTSAHPTMWRLGAHSRGATAETMAAAAASLLGLAFCLGLSSAAGAPAAAATPVKILLADALLVLPPLAAFTCAELRAAQELASELGALSGGPRPLQITHEPLDDRDDDKRARGPAPLIYVGATAASRRLTRVNASALAPEEAVAVAEGGALYVLGDDLGSPLARFTQGAADPCSSTALGPFPQCADLMGPPSCRSGTYTAAATLLREELGVRWVWPGEDGVARPPPTADLAVSGTVLIRAAPPLTLRRIRRVDLETYEFATALGPWYSANTARGIRSVPAQPHPGCERVHVCAVCLRCCRRHCCCCCHCCCVVVLLVGGGGARSSVRACAFEHVWRRRMFPRWGRPVRPAALKESSAHAARHECRAAASSIFIHAARVARVAAQARPGRMDAAQRPGRARDGAVGASL